jgi:hypothetical protein
VKIPSDWQKQAYCANDSNASAWLSYSKKEVEYAKEGCSRCSVRLPCILNALQASEYVGVNAGISEYDFLLRIWREASDEKPSNWSRSDKLLQRIVREVK